jgi:hypothetical protein
VFKAEFDVTIDDRTETVKSSFKKHTFFELNNNKKTAQNICTLTKNQKKGAHGQTDNRREFG